MQHLPVDTEILSTVIDCLRGFSIVYHKFGYINGQGDKVILLEAKKNDTPTTFAECNVNKEEYRWLLIHGCEVTYLAPGAFQMLSDLMQDYLGGRMGKEINTAISSVKSNIGKKRRNVRNNKIDVAVEGKLNKDTNCVDVNII